MIVLATVSDPSRVAIRIDLATGESKMVPSRAEFFDESIVGRPNYRPFGITWYDDEIYIVNHRQLLVFDKDLDYRRTLNTVLQGNTHQIAYRAGIVWVSSPWTNSIIGVSLADGEPAQEFEIDSKSIRKYSDRISFEDNDRYHLNSILWTSDRCYLVAHNFGRSMLLCYDHSFQLKNLRVDVGQSIHGLANYMGDLYFLSTGTNEIKSDSGYRIRLSRPGFARGFAMTDEHFVVAISQHRSVRSERTIGDSWIQVYNRKKCFLESEHHVLGTGSINDLRLLDVHDYAHGVPPYLAPRYDVGRSGT